MSHLHQPPPPKKTRGARPARSRGAQPGNNNALKHGYYTRQFLEKERKALDQIPISDLQEEMKILRAFLRRYLKELDAIAPGDHKAVQDTLYTVCLVSSQLVALARVQSRGQFFTAETGFIRAWAKSLMEGEPKSDEN
jgi:hypothetical protein